MRAVFGIVSLVVVLAIVGLLAKAQLSGQSSPAAANTTGLNLPVITPGATPQQQSQQVQEQFKQSLEGALQQARPMPDDNK